MMRKLAGGSSNSRSPSFVVVALAAVVFVACAVVVSASSVDANAAATTTVTASACSTVDTTVENCPADIDVDDRRPSQRSSSRRRSGSSSSSQQQPLFRFGFVGFDRRTINFNQIFKQRQQLLLELMRERNSLVQQEGNYAVSSPSIATMMKVRGGAEDDDESSDDDEIEEESEAEEEPEEEESSTEEVDDEDEEEEETDWAAVAKDVSEKAIDVTQTTVVPFLLTFSQKAYKICRVLSIRTYHAFQRAYQAGVDGDDDDEDEDEEEDDDEDEETSISTVLIKYATKTFKVAKRMVVAALDFSEEDDDVFGFGSDDDEDTTDVETSQEEEDDDDEEKVAVEKKDKSKTKKKSKSTSGVTDDETEGENKKQPDTPLTATKAPSDAGKYLSETYDVPDDREDGQKRLDIWGGSFKDALKSAQDQARLLVVFIPATQPKSKGGFSIFGGGGKVDETLLEKDKQAIEGLFSSKVAKAAARKPLKKGDKTLGSFAVWTAKNGSPEANEVFRRMKVTETSTKGKKRPILCVVYPSFGMSSGLPKIVPSLLVQHHGNPPPNPEDMATWLNSLRKRHPKQYEKLQRQVHDLQIYKEVKEGYEGSIKADKKREKEEAKAEAERKAKAEAEAARLAAIEERRKILLEELPDDKKGKDIKRIALRFPDGRKGERGFDPDQPVSVLLNWVDAMFEIERENVILTTMNGKITLSWEEYGSSDKTLADVGLGKSTAFRVTEQVVEDDNTDTSKLML